MHVGGEDAVGGWELYVMEDSVVKDPWECCKSFMLMTWHCTEPDRGTGNTGNQSAGEITLSWGRLL